MFTRPRGEQIVSVLGKPRGKPLAETTLSDSIAKSAHAQM